MSAVLLYYLPYSLETEFLHVQLSKFATELSGSPHLHFSLVIQEQPCLAFHMGTGDLNSGPHISKASTLTHWAFLQTSLLLVQ